MAERKDAEGWFDVSTLKEPYRLEGKKTMGYEAGRTAWLGIAGRHLLSDRRRRRDDRHVESIREMEALGWIGPKRPKMIAVQAEGCQPIVRAFQEHAERSRFWEGAATVASGLRVPKPLGDFLVLQAVRESGGTAVAVPDAALIDAGIRLAAEEGLFVAPEGAACVAAAERLIREGFLKADDRILIYNTGSGLKYLEAYGAQVPAAYGR